MSRKKKAAKKNATPIKQGPVTPGTPLHRMLLMIASEVANALASNSSSDHSHRRK